MATAAATGAVSNGNGKAAVAQTLVEIPLGTQRSLGPGDEPPEPFLYRNLEEVAAKLGAAPSTARILAWKRKPIFFTAAAAANSCKERAGKRRAGRAKLRVLKCIFSIPERLSF